MSSTSFGTSLSTPSNRSNFTVSFLSLGAEVPGLGREGEDTVRSSYSTWVEDQQMVYNDQQVF